MTRKRSFGEVFGGVLGPGPSRGTLAAQRPRVIAAMNAAIRPPHRRALTWIGAAAAAALVVAGIFRWTSGTPAELTGVWNGRELTERTTVEGRSATGEVLEFSDGTRVQVASSAELTLSRVAPRAVALSLGNGLIRASVAKATGRSWSVLAGPYRVQVVGTDFSVEWDARTAEIDVRVIEGRVLVLGFDLPPGGLALEAGGRFNRRAARELPGLPAPNAGPAQAALAPSAAVEPALPPRALATSSASRSAGARASEPSPPEDWRALASRQRYAEALAAAREVGFEHLLPALNDNDLLLLANTARYAGALPEAQRTLMELRSRFPRSPSATVAALVLAGIAERAKNPSEAARWLRTFLAESPNGELSAGARARLLGILVRAGQRAEARRVATDYLRYHPNGPYVTEARGVLDSGTLP